MNRSRRFPTTAVVLLASLAALNACTSGTSDGARRADGDSVIEEFAPGQRSVLGDFSGTTLNGATFQLTQYRNDIVVVNVWGSWCVPCRVEADALRRTADDFASAGVRFIGVDVRDNDAAAKAFERTYGITYPSITSATSAEAVLRVSQVVPSSAVPSTLVLDRDGAVAARVVGASSYTTLTQLVEAVVAEDTTGQE